MFAAKINRKEIMCNMDNWACGNILSKITPEGDDTVTIVFTVRDFWSI